ncbi:MAG: iron-containing redox enzyme family protein [Bdellovibrionota bacterium]
MKISRTMAFTEPHLQEILSYLKKVNWKDPLVYADFLAQTHYHICHSTRLLAAAGSLLDTTPSQDHLHIQCVKHAGEERSHEKLSTSDLAELGYKLQDFPELQSTKALYRNAYYLIDRVSPFTMFGYAFILECLGPRATEIESLLKTHYGPKAVKHLSLHAHEDPEHIEGYVAMLDALSGREQAWVEEGVASTAYLYKRIFIEICEHANANHNNVVIFKKSA